MIYKYYFYAPFKYLIKSENDEEEIVPEKLHIKFPKLFNIASNWLKQVTSDFIEYMNHDGMDVIEFQLKNKLIIKIHMDHVLKKQEFNSIYIDLVTQLMEGLGNKISSHRLYDFIDKVEYVNDKNLKEIKSVEKYIYLLPWFEPGWKLEFIQKGIL